MFTRSFTTMIVCSLLSILAANVCTGRSSADSATARRVSSGEKMVLRQLGLSPDVNDSEIIQLLHDPRKRGSVRLLIRYRRVSSAVPQLLQIVNDPNSKFFDKFGAAKALCDFGNREWMPTIKAFVADPNSTKIGTAHAVRVAGLLARAGDYSHFRLVAKSATDSNWWMRHTAVMALANFRHRTHPVTDSAVESLRRVAVSDQVPRLREQAIYSLQKIAKTKHEVTSKLIEALEANADSAESDHYRRLYERLLKHYREKAKTD